ncbi:hypothetical protein D9M68_701190 [compost metagenome]
MRSSTRATSEGSDSARKEFLRLAGFSRFIVPAATICSHRRSYSSCEPSHQQILSGLVNAAISATQATSLGCLTQAGAFTGAMPCIVGWFILQLQVCKGKERKETLQSLAGGAVFSLLARWAESRDRGRRSSCRDRHIPLQLRGGPCCAKGRGGPCGCATVALRPRRGSCARRAGFVRRRPGVGSRARPTIRGATGAGKDTTGAPPCFLLRNN